MLRILFTIPLEWMGFPDLPVYSYGFMIMTGAILAMVLAVISGRRKGIPAGIIYEASIVLGVSGYLGAKVCWFILQYLMENSVDPNLSILSRRAGISSMGGAGGVVLSGMVYAYFRKIKPGVLADCFAPGSAVFAGMMRIGCLLNGCCFGTTLTEEHWYSVVYPAGSPAAIFHHGPEAGGATASLPTLPFQPVMVLCGILIAAALLILRNRCRFDGQLFLRLLQMYAIALIAAEFMREGVDHYFQTPSFPGLNLNQILASAGLIGATVLDRVICLRQALS